MASPNFGILQVGDSRNNFPLRALTQKLDNYFPKSDLAFLAVLPEIENEVELFLNFCIKNECNIILTLSGSYFPSSSVLNAIRSVKQDDGIPSIENSVQKYFFTTSPDLFGIKNKSVIFNLPGGNEKLVMKDFCYISKFFAEAISIVTNHEMVLLRQHGPVHTNLLCESVVDVISGNTTLPSTNFDYPLITVSNAVGIIFEKCPQQKETEKVALEDAFGCVLAEDIFAKCNHPNCDFASRDGYAVNSYRTFSKLFTLLDFEFSSSENFRTDNSESGLTWKFELQRGQAVKIMKGMPVPAGTTAIVGDDEAFILSVDNTSKIKLRSIPIDVENIDLEGNFVKKGSLILRENQPIGVESFNILAIFGIPEIVVYKKPSLGIITVGRLLGYTEKLSPGYKVDSNTHAFKAILKKYGYKDVKHYGIVHYDDKEKLKTVLKEAFALNDFVVTIGATSIQNEFDYLKSILRDDFQATIHFGGIFMQPGKSTTLATVDFEGKSRIIFSLPGYNNSCMVTTLLFVVPALKHFENCNNFHFPRAKAQIVVNRYVFNPDIRPNYRKAFIKIENGGFVATPTKLFGTDEHPNYNSLVLVPPKYRHEDNNFVFDIIIVDDLEN